MASIINCSTLIVGAGMSGITASVELLKNGHDDLLIIDALDRIGGRMNTVQAGERHIELGAQWIHGQVGNPIFEIAKANGLLEDGYEEIGDFSIGSGKADLDAMKELFVEPNINDENVSFYLLNEDGTMINSKILITLFKIADETIESFYEDEHSLETLNLSGDLRFVDVFRKNFMKRVDEHFSDLLQRVKSLENSDEILRNFEKVVNTVYYNKCKLESSMSGCTDIYNLSYKNYTRYRVYEGNSLNELKYGYKAVLDAIISAQKDKFYERLRLNHHLKSICVCEKLLPKEGVFGGQDECEHCRFTDDENKVVVKLLDKSDKQNKEVLVICDRVLCTVSLGYLKKNVNTLFEPVNLIDDAKRLAINRMGFGTINKIHFFYDTTEKFWNNSEELVIATLCPSIESSDPSDLSRLIVKNWLESVITVSSVYNRKDCLTFWITGSELEGVSDEFLSVELTNLLRKYLKNEQVPRPKSVVKSTWSSNPYFRGSYSYIPIGGRATDPDELARPLPSVKKPLVLFAGEHTHSSYFSTVHGAHLSGLRESERILSQSQLL